MTKALPGHSAELEDLGVMDIGEADALDWTNDERVALPDLNKIIVPFLWKILVMPMRPRPVTKGGILIPQTRQDADQYLTYVGRIVALGPLCYKHPKFKGMGITKADVPRRGDWMLYGVNSYQRIDFKGAKLILLNDDSFLAKVPKGVSPWDFKLER